MRSQLAETTYQKDYVRKIANHIRDFPTKDARKAIQIRDWLLANLSTETAKRTLRYMSTCCRWAVRSHTEPSQRESDERQRLLPLLVISA